MTDFYPLDDGEAESDDVIVQKGCVARCILTASVSGVLMFGVCFAGSYSSGMAPMPYGQPTQRATQATAVPFLQSTQLGGTACNDICSSDEVSLACRACENGLSISKFCHACVEEGLNDLGCRQCDVPGADKDEHGCLPSAGYSWCEATSSCIRPWEEGIQSPSDFKEHCGKKADEKPEAEADENRNHECNCPPTEVVYPCTQEEFDALMTGQDCPFYRENTPVIANAVKASGSADTEAP